MHSFGTSFDHAVDAGSLPIVLRGEFLYVRASGQPVVDNCRHRRPDQRAEDGGG